MCKVRTSLAALALLAVGGCMQSALPPIRQDAAVVPPDLILTTDDGAKLPVRVWRPGPFPARAAILALHGYGDSRDAWDRVGPYMAAHDFALYAIDQRGFGAAPGRGHWPGTGRMLEDVAEAAAAMQAREPGAPVYIMGESMGGAEVLLLSDGLRLARHGVHPRSMVALAPAVWGRGQMNPITLLSLDTADVLAPDWMLTGREIPLHVHPSDDQAALLRIARDPLTLTGSRVSLLDGLVGQMTAAQAAASRVRIPVLVAYGAKDDLVPPAAMAAAWAKFPPGVRTAYYAHGFHLMMRDLDRQAVEGDVVAWIDMPEAPLPSGADVQAAGWTASRAWDEHAPFWSPDAWTRFLDTQTQSDPQ